MRQLFAVMAVLCLFTGCADELGANKKPVEAKIEQLSISDLSVKITGLKEPNSYQVEISWPKLKGTIRFSEKSKILSVVPASEQKFIQSQVSGGSELSYLVEQVTEDGRISSSTPIFVKIPVDTVFDSEISLKENLKIEAERVFFLNSAVLTTLDKNLSIISKEIISQGGIIQNFTEGTQAPHDKYGRSGGMINIVSQKASGSIHIFLRGENGGSGRNGAITFPGRHPGCAGISGGNGGNSGNLVVNIGDGHNFNFNFTVQEGKKGIAGARGSVPSGPDSEVVNAPCDSETPNGVDGEPGAKGQVCLKLSVEQDYVCQ